ncbi:MAG: alpha/beta hydrolase-fold protein [Actinomycetota bacterium]|nr:alpha/beta hydrolase-fold protein [Actinomycetota bacterium]
MHPLPVEGGREARVYVPPGLAADRPVPLVLTLHGAGGDARGGLDFIQRVAEERRLILLAPASGGSTWDAVRGDYGRDVERVDEALARTFAMLPVRPEAVAVAGFSDGASYALGLGLGNGELFGSVLAFSPGFVPRPDHQGKPRVFVSHGVADDVLPIDRTSRRIVPELRREGHDVRYEEFPDGHTVPPELARQAVDWWAPEL